MHSGSDFTEELILVEAKSYLDRAEQINRKIQAKQAASMVLVPLGFVFALAIISLSFVYAAMPESNRMARANQEQVYVQR